MLVRALEPTHGLERLRARRGLDDLRLLCAGPGRLCQALGVTREHDGLALDTPPFELLAATGRPEVVAAPRIGISVATEQPWRYCAAGLPLPQPAAPAFAADRATTSCTLSPGAAASPGRGFCSRIVPGVPSA